MTEDSPQNEALSSNAPPEMESLAQTIKAVVLPLDQFERVMDALREAPHRYADSVIKELRGVQVHDIKVSTPTKQ